LSVCVLSMKGFIYSFVYSLCGGGGDDDDDDDNSDTGEK
jgi:hypothetical protein